MLVTADLPPFVSGGSRIDVAISSLGDASSLLGGTLVMTQLRAADGEVYAVAQGAIAVGGYSIEGAAQTVSQGVATSGRIPNGALIEREVQGQLQRHGIAHSRAEESGFRDGDANHRRDKHVWSRAIPEPALPSSAIIERSYCHRPRSVSPVRFIAEIDELLVEPDTPARVVVDERTGTVVIGRNVQISTVAVTHGNLTVRITEAPIVSQPSPFSRGRNGRGAANIHRCQ